MRLARIAPLLALAGCAGGQAGGGAAPEPVAASEHIQVLSADLLGAQLSPCYELAGLDLDVRVDTTGLSALHGSVRSGGAQDGEPPTAYLVEAVLDYRDASGRSVHREVIGQQLPDVADGKRVVVQLASAWDGVSYGPDGVAVVRAGTLQLDTSVSLLRLSGNEGKTLREELLETLELHQRIDAASPTERCLEWERLAPGFASANGHVRVHGRETTAAPSIAWRDGRPWRLFGELFVQPAGGRPLDAVSGFLRAHPRLFGIQDLALAGRLALEGEHHDSDGSDRLRLRQQAPVQRAGGGPPALLPLQDARLTALLDDTRQLVLLTGRFLEDAEGPFAAPLLTSAEAGLRVGDHLANTGRSRSREVALVEEVVAGRTAADYQAAYVFRVGPGDAGFVPLEAPEERLRAFEVTVSARTGAILRVRERSVFLDVPGRVLQYDPADPAPDSSLVTPDPPRGGTCPDVPPHQQPQLLGATASATLRIDDRDSGDDFFLADTEDARGAIDEMEFDSLDDPLGWGDTNAFATPLADPALDAVAVRAMTAFSQVQSFWDRFATQFLAEDDWSDLTLIVDHEDMDNPCSPAEYQGGEIRISRHFAGSALYALWHETLHYFDERTADLEISEYGEDGEHRMPFAIKEGVAHFFEQVGSGMTPNNQAAVGTGALLCIWTGRFQRCMEPWLRIQRSARIVPLPWHRPLKLGQTDLSIWPDCRDASDRNGHCMFVRIPVLNSDGEPTGADGTFAWNGIPASPFLLRSLVPQILQDIWETGSTLEPDLRFRDEFPSMVLKALSLLPSEASLGDFRDCLLAANFLLADRMPANTLTQGTILSAFTRHGVDLGVDAFCADEETSELCH